MADPLDRLASGFRGRTVKTLKLLGRAGLSMARRHLVGQPSNAGGDEDAAVQAAERLLRELDPLKGLAMKFGQMASYLSHSLPPQAQRVLARLQSQSLPMSGAVAAEVVRAELGAEPEALFDSFERTPFAAASIGQVHQASLDGQALAVKVQYPGVIEALESDLKTLQQLARIGLVFLPLDTGELTAELRDRVLEECDYTREARNQSLFRGIFTGHPDRSVPEVLARRSSERVLTSTFAVGQSFQAFARTAPQPIRDRAGETIFAACFETIFQRCVFNADPHPGNYLFGEDGHVTFLDFGCVKRFPVAMIESWKALARCLLDEDRHRFPDCYAATGMVANARTFDWDFQWRAMSHLYAPYRSRLPTVFTPEFIEKTYDLIVFRNPNKFRTPLPRDWLFVNRLQFGLLSVLAHLGARGNWGVMFRAAIESPTQPLSLDERSAPNACVSPK